MAREHFDIAIIGAGPAGLSAALSAASKKLSHILFEKGEIGNTIYDYQLRKHVMAEPTKLPLRSPLSFAAGKRESILEKWEKEVGNGGVNLERSEIIKLEKVGNIFELSSREKQYTARTIILAIGMQGTPRTLGVEGEDLPHVAYTLADPDAFNGKDIIVVGAGDAAIENAMALAERNRVTVINRGSEFARAKDANAAQIEKAIAADKIRCFYDAEILTVTPETVAISGPDGTVPVPCNHIIARIGCIMPRKFLESCGIAFPNKDPSTPPKVSERYESNVPGLYILGALVGYPLIKQAINQGFEVIQHLIGEPVEPADEILVDEKLKGLPGNVKSNLEMIRESLPFFVDLSTPQFRELIAESTVHQLEPREQVFEKNDYTDTFFSIVKGSVRVAIGEGREAEIRAGEFFGEIGLLSGRRRTATVFAGESCILLETPRKQMIKLINSVDSLKKATDRAFALRALQSVIFRGAATEALEALVLKTKSRLAKKDEVLFREGDEGDALYIIRKGSVKISRRSHDNVDVVQTYLSAGNFFGEMAILSDGFRSATVTAAVPSELLVITKADALVYFEAFPQVRGMVKSVADSRKIQNLFRTQDDGHGELLDFMFGEGVTDAENVLVIDSDLCVSCDNCESACAATHHGYSRLDRKGGKSFASVQLPISCRHCENPLCMVDCPPDALTRRPNGEVVIRDSCIGCGNCVRNCPYGVIQMVYDSSKSGASFWSKLFKTTHEKGPAKAAKCDLCEGLDGGPACVRACPTGAALRVNPSKLLQLFSPTNE